MLYLSAYLKARRAEYYDRLTAIRMDGDWEGWIKFFLRGVVEVSESAARTARRILEMRESHRKAVENPQLLDYLFEQPLVTVGMVKDRLGCSFPTASKFVAQSVDRGWLREVTGRERNRLFRYDPYLALFEGSGATSGPPPIGGPLPQGPGDPP